MSKRTAAETPVVRVEYDRKSHLLTFLSWDTEGGQRVSTNLLRKPVAGVLVRVDDNAEVMIELRADEVSFSFAPRVRPTTALPAVWNDDGTFQLPAIVNAPDFGPMLLTQISGRPLMGRIEGSRVESRVDLILTGALGAELRLQPLLLPPPDGLTDVSLWPSARRGWLHGIQACARWGEQGRPFSAPAGILGNNVLSDPASCSLWFYADQASFTPQPVPGISLMPMLRRTIDYWIDHKMVRDASGRETGEIICYWDHTGFLDANAGPLIAAWDYVEVTGDHDWLRQKIGRLEMTADFLISRDIDGDGVARGGIAHRGRQRHTSAREECELARVKKL